MGYLTLVAVVSRFVYLAANPQRGGVALSCVSLCGVRDRAKEPRGRLYCAVLLLWPPCYWL